MRRGRQDCAEQLGTRLWAHGLGLNALLDLTWKVTPLSVPSVPCL